MATNRWVEPLYSKRQINDAGNVIRRADKDSEDYINAIRIINNWREAHAYPMQVIYVHLRRMRENSRITVASRLKRMESIEKKLLREEKMELWRMQDLGGCRFIVESVSDVYYYIDKLKHSRMRHIIKTNEHDYIQSPKSSGYRSFHLVLQYKSDKPSKEVFNRNMLIEIQFRTRTQHIWATAVETMGNLLQQELKSSLGDEQVQRFFLLVSSYFAHIENCPLVPNTPTNLEELRNDIKAINQNMHILERLNAYRLAMDFDEKSISSGEKSRREKYYYLLNLNYGNDEEPPSIRVGVYKNANQAFEAYTTLELEDNVNRDVVLIQSESFSEVKKAYPNYFSDIALFVRRVQKFITQ